MTHFDDCISWLIFGQNNIGIHAYINHVLWCHGVWNSPPRHQWQPKLQSGVAKSELKNITVQCVTTCREEGREEIDRETCSCNVQSTLVIGVIGECVKMGGFPKAIAWVQGWDDICDLGTGSFTAHKGTCNPVLLAGRILCRSHSITSVHVQNVQVDFPSPCGTNITLAGDENIPRDILEVF